jgi:P27 family predicted phage terminase small subunit
VASRGPLPDPNSERSTRARKAAERNGKALVPGARSERPTTVPDAPAQLGELGKRTWAQIWLEPQILQGDRLTVERLALLEDESAGLRASVAADGAILRRPLQSARGQVLGEELYEHPALPALRKLGVEQANLCRELGLTPQARARLGLVVAEVVYEPDELDELKARRTRRRLPLVSEGDRV